MNSELVSLFDAALRQSVSDIHLLPGEAPRFRWNGELTPVTDIPPISQEALLSAFPTLTRSSLENGTLSFAETVLPHNDFIFVIYIYRSSGQFAANIRIMLGNAPNLEKVGGDRRAEFEEFAAMKQGFLLVTGPVASGKHTTAFAVLQQINRTQARRIHLLEDSPAYWLHSDKSLVSSLVIGQDVPDFESALRLLIRGADPDVIFLPDLPTAEVVQLALHMVRMGHLVVASATAPSASGALTTICQSVSPDTLPTLREHLIAVTNQRLMRRASGSGRVPAYEILRGSVVRDSIRQDVTATAFQETFTDAVAPSDELPENNGDSLRVALRALLDSGEIAPDSYQEALSDYRAA